MTVAEIADAQHVPVRHWTDAEDEMLRAEYPTSLDVPDLADRMGRTVKSVHARARRIGLKKAPGVRAQAARVVSAEKRRATLAAKLQAAEAARPACMTTTEFLAWRKAGKLTPAHPSVGVCEDCTPHFAAAMRAEGRCDRPEIRFFRRAAMTWTRKANGSATEEGPRVGYAHAPNAGEIYGDIRADSYTYVDLTTGKTLTVRDAEVPMPIIHKRSRNGAGS